MMSECVVRTRFDVDQNRKLNAAEFSTLCLEWLGVGADAAQILLSHFDSNRDGELDLDEISYLIQTGRSVTRSNSGLPSELQPYALSGQQLMDFETTVSTWVAKICRPVESAGPVCCVCTTRFINDVPCMQGPLCRRTFRLRFALAVAVVGLAARVASGKQMWRTTRSGPR